MPVDQNPVPAHQRHADKIAALHQAVLQSPGVTDPVMRDAAYRGSALPEPWQDYVTKVQSESTHVSDGDIDRLSAAGCSQDAIFEITVAAALGAAAHRLEAGLRAMKREG